jgi:hypothetical protein
MIVTDKFVFVHLPRSGGTFVSEVIRKFFPSAHEIGYHLPRTLLPREYSHLPILGAVRNPWEFYVSWYHHVWPRDATSPLISWVTENGKLGFCGTTRNALNLGVNNERLDALIEMLPEQVDYQKRNIPNITKEAMRGVRGTGIGYYTFRFNHLFGNASDVFVCRFETLRRDVINFFEGIGAATDELRDYVLRSSKKNISEHLHYSTYYTPDLAELVIVRDRPLIERFEYVFEQASSGEDAVPQPLEKPKNRHGQLGTKNEKISRTKSDGSGRAMR